MSAGFKKARSNSEVVGKLGSIVVGEKAAVSVLSSPSKATDGGSVDISAEVDVSAEVDISAEVDVALLFALSCDVLSVVDRNVFTCLLLFMAAVSLRASSSFFLCLARPRIFCEIEWILARE